MEDANALVSVRHEELGRRLCAAFISVRLGITLEYALRTKCAGPIGDYWIDLAKQVERDDLNARDLRNSRRQ